MKNGRNDEKTAKKEEKRQQGVRVYYGTGRKISPEQNRPDQSEMNPGFGAEK